MGHGEVGSRQRKLSEAKNEVVTFFFLGEETLRHVGTFHGYAERCQKSMEP